MPDPIAVITAVSQGLNLVDKFTDLTRKLYGREVRPYSVEAKREGESIKIVQDGHVAESISAAQMNMLEWDDKRYETLKDKIDANWDIYNDIDRELPVASVDEKARLKRRLKNVRDDLCKDFLEFVKLAEKILGTRLGDHYSLYETCGMDMPEET